MATAPQNAYIDYLKQKAETRLAEISTGSSTCFLPLEAAVRLEISPASPFSVSADTLMRLVDPKSLDVLHTLGGVAGVAAALHVDVHNGLDERQTEDLAVRRACFGRNVLLIKTPRPFLGLVWDALHDRTLVLLMIAALVSLAIGIYKDARDDPGGDAAAPHYSWIESVAILVAILIVVLVSSGNDYQKECQFRRLNAKKEDRNVRVIRNGGAEQLLGIHDLLVGDVVSLEPGDVMPCDGVLIPEGHHQLVADESSITGESDPIHKSVDADPFLISSSKIVEGVGRCVTVAVGVRSVAGKCHAAIVGTEKADTPLQHKLNRLANNIAKLGLAISLLMLLILGLKFLLQVALGDAGPGDPIRIVDGITNIFIQAVTILVVAVPEGLPMAVTIALAFATNRMLRDNNFVRVLSACETMGSATTVCSDKTGTLTTNVMTVVAARWAGRPPADAQAGVVAEGRALATEARNLVVASVCINSSAFRAGKHADQVWVGSKTEAALLNMALSWDAGLDVQDVRDSHSVHRLFPFSSERKSMTVIIRTPTHYRLFVKGASEILLGYCTHVGIGVGDALAMDEPARASWEAYISQLAGQGLRTIALAYADYALGGVDPGADGPPDADYTLLGVVGIEDPVRDGVPEAVLTCQRAGIFVRMVTGDNLATASSIARKCHILTRGGVAMEGSQFRTLSEASMTAIVPKLQVLARSSPLDKQILVGRLKEMGEVVAVTGDGTNDGPALKMADVGFSMGITGTEIAKEASAIILLDDNFTSIIRALAWGRCIHDSVRKFLMFQLSVNMTAVVIAFVSAVMDVDNQSVLTAVQLLWVNLLMDTMAALALATESPAPELLLRQPEDRTRSLVTLPMVKMILGQSLFQIALVLVLLQAGPAVLRLDMADPSQKCVMDTLIFNVFVFLQLFNEFNCRLLPSDGDSASYNIFYQLSHNVIFLAIITVSILGQFVIVKFGGQAFSTVPLSWSYWMLSLGLAALSWPIGLILRLVPVMGWTEAEDQSTGTPPSRLLSILSRRRRASAAPSMPSRVYYSKERLHWQAAIRDVRHGLSVFNALRRPPPPLA